MESDQTGYEVDIVSAMLINKFATGLEDLAHILSAPDMLEVVDGSVGFWSISAWAVRDMVA